MANKQTSTSQPERSDGRDKNNFTASGGVSELNQDHINYDPIKIYSERAPYSKTSKVTEIHGPHIQQKVNTVITHYAKLYDEMIAQGTSAGKSMASGFENVIKKIHTQFEHLKNLKEEWMMLRGGGMRGKGTVSNITDPRFPDAFFTEKGDIDITPEGEIIAKVPELGLYGSSKFVNDIALDWESKGDGEGRFMSALQDMQESGSRGDKHPPLDPDYFVSNLLEEYWPQALADKWGGVYALHDILPEMIKENGGTADGLNMSIESFNPSVDMRLHRYYTDRLKKAYNPAHLTNNMIEQEEEEEPNTAQKLMNTLADSSSLEASTRRAIDRERQSGKI